MRWKRFSPIALQRHTTLKILLLTFVASTFIFGGGILQAQEDKEPAPHPQIDVKDLETPEDPELEIPAGTPIDCVENDERPPCQVRSRGIVPVRLENQHWILCLRPANGSSGENVHIVMSSCKYTKSRLWYKRPSSGYPNAFQLQNAHTGKCIYKSGTNLIQRTCNIAGTNAADFRFSTGSAPGSGNFLYWNIGGGTCVRGHQGDVYLSSCINSPTRRWRQLISPILLF